MTNQTEHAESRIARRPARRARIAGAGAALAAAAALVGSSGALATSTHSNRSQSPSAAKVAVHSSRSTAAAKHRRAKKTHRTKLHRYTGAQLPGFTVTEIPAGWHLSTSTPTALLITPDDGSLGNDPDVFAGKLAVLPQSVDEQGLGPGTPVTVNGQPGHIDPNAGGGETVLRYTTPDGHAVDIQAPAALHWTDSQLVAFAEGVTVTANVGTTHG